MVKRTFGPIGVAVAMMACMLMALPAVASATTATKVTIEAQQGGFFGYVKSSKGSCEAGRKVTLYKQKGVSRNRGVDKRVGTDTAQPNGPHSMWSINTDLTGKFYVYVSPTSGCAAAYSNSVKSQ